MSIYVLYTCTRISFFSAFLCEGSKFPTNSNFLQPQPLIFLNPAPSWVWGSEKLGLENAGVLSAMGEGSLLWPPPWGLHLLRVFFLKPQIHIVILATVTLSWNWPDLLSASYDKHINKRLSLKLLTQTASGIVGPDRCTRLSQWNSGWSLPDSVLALFKQESLHLELARQYATWS